MRTNHLRSKIVMTAAALFAVLSLTTCETLQTVFQEPQVSLHSVDLANINFNGAQVLCKVQVENPNPFTIPFPETGWELFINTRSFVSGVVRNNRSIRARDTTIVEVPVNLNYVDVFNTFASLKGSRQTSYKVALAVKFAIPLLGDKVWNFDFEGQLPVLQIPRLSSPSMRVESSDLTKADVLISVNIENPNAFELPPVKIFYDYSLNRSSFLTGRLESAPLAAGSATPVAIRLTVNYADLFRAFVSLLTSSQVTSSASLDCDFGIPAFNDRTNLQIPGTLPLRR